MIVSNTPTVIELTYNYDVTNIVQQKINGKWQADVQYSVYDQDNNFIESILLSYTGEEYNQWFDNYNSGKFLLEELIVKKQLNADIPLGIEQEFINLGQ